MKETKETPKHCMTWLIETTMKSVRIFCRQELKGRKLDISLNNFINGSQCSIVYFYIIFFRLLYVLKSLIDLSMLIIILIQPDEQKNTQLLIATAGLFQAMVFIRRWSNCHFKLSLHDVVFITKYIINGFPE